MRCGHGAIIRFVVMLLIPGIPQVQAQATLCAGLLGYKRILLYAVRVPVWAVSSESPRWKCGVCCSTNSILLLSSPPPPLLLALATLGLFLGLVRSPHGPRTLALLAR